MRTYAAEVAARLQRAGRREDKDMSENAEQVNTLVEEIDERLGRLVEMVSARNEAASHVELLDAQERIDDLERQLATVTETNNGLMNVLKEEHERLQAAYVTREVPWSDVAAGMMTIARDGTPWMVGIVHDDGRVILRNADTPFEKRPKKGETVRVLVPYVTPEQAEALVANELGGVQA